MKILLKNWRLNIIAGLTGLIGVLTLGSTLYSLLHLRDARLVLADAHFTVIAAVSLIYLAMTLRRGKHNAWLISLLVGSLILARNLRHFVFDDEITPHYAWLVLSNLLLPACLLVMLLSWRRLFNVQSSAVAFRIAVRRTIIILLVAFLYGAIGFQLLDRHDFRQEIGPATAAHYTLDQFGLTTNDKPTAHTRRAVLFVDSLASVSLVSLAYIAMAFFAPVRMKVGHHHKDYLAAEGIVKKNSRSSEDFFKLWPHDKAYFFNHQRTGLIAYRVERGVALSVADPIGEKSSVLEEFMQLCRANDWRPAFIHTDKSHLKLYKKHGLEAQKIGEEALVNIKSFNDKVSTSKYFRNITNRFSKAGYSFEILTPPHSDSLIRRLQLISNDWLAGPGRVERGFMMGYFTPAYIERCTIAVAKNSEGQIQAFLNQVPTIKIGEANYDFLRHATGSPNNINDFLMLNFISWLGANKFKTLNMGLCPLSGLDESAGEDKNLLDGILRFAYANGGRFYSFEGLKRFKSKYEPVWEPRYIIYNGGLPGFGRVLGALLRAMTRSVNKR